MSLPHTIERQFIDATVVGSEDVAPDIMQRLSRLCTEIPARQLEEMLGPFDDMEGLAVIDKLTIETGQVTLDNLEGQLTRAVREAFSNLIAELRTPASTRGLRMIELDPSVREFRELDKPTAHVRAFIHFLRHGRLPWWYTLEQETSLRALMSSIVVSGRLEQHLANEFVEALELRVVARHRLAAQFEPAVAIAIIARFDQKLADALQAGLFITEQLRASLQTGAAFERQLVRIVVDAIVDGAEIRRDSTGDLVSIIILKTIERMHDRFGHDDRLVVARFQATELPKEAIEEDSRRGDARRADEPPSEIVPDDADVMTADGLFVDNAGVVLLHPFLPRLFSEIGLHSHDELMNVSRCALLIHHLATGSRTAEEHELTFAKVMCGLPVEFPLDFEPPINQQEADECEVLLQSAINHWDALRDTSPDGLRGNFLTRPGKLSLDGDVWMLIVEHQSYDILLDHLPWGIGLVKLPWMRAMIRVEWPS